MARLLSNESYAAGIKELADSVPPARLGNVGVHHFLSQRLPYQAAVWLHGIRLDGIVNQARHDREVPARSTKHPPHFGIDLLIDDSEGVRLEGRAARLSGVSSSAG